MERLHPSDPSRIAGHRLLGRLGAGGMGVVYLGRTADGALAAVKVIRAEYADEADFRARFRREAAIAARVDSPWAVRVTGADPDAAEPWLATSFVPGPSLAEAVTAHGPLPLRAVRILGKALARALDVMHGQGLVHRDVKPANVLLGMDGPRLIDFGIARGGEHTALTSTDVVLGTPGFLSPEQARGRAAEPAGDVFSLGCLLAYAATGRLPFGTGAVDAVLYRTVHDEPELGPEVLADPELTGLLRTALAKHPDLRPTARELDEALTEDDPGAGTGWLPDPVVAAIAERAAGLLALPGIEETVADPAAEPTVTATTGAGSGSGGRAVSRRRMLRLASAGAVVAAGGGVVAALASRWGKGTPAAPAGRKWAIGVHADLTGPQRVIGKAQLHGVELAVAAFNSRSDRPFTVTVRSVDDAGDPARSPRAAAELVGDPDVFAVVGPTGNASVAPCLEVYGEAALPLLTVSALGTTFGVADRRSFFQTSALSLGQGHAVALQLAHAQGARRIGLVCDRAGDAEGWQAVLQVSRALPFIAAQAVPYARVLPRESGHDLPVVLADLLAQGVDAVFCTGTPARTAQAAQWLDTAGFKGPRIADYTVVGEEFLSAAGPAAEGWQVLAPYTGPDAPPVLEHIRSKHRDGTSFEPWTAEAYDTAGLVLDRLVTAARSGGGRPTRAGLLSALGRGTYRGVVKEYAFDERQQVKGNPYFHHLVQRRGLRYQGPAPQLPAG
ncbi:bifunctional serine/threonine-protein kinase/ABC transporter substrate-binding protein [Streptomyces sp. NPDC127106]|uniref:bifunctional serine/threonine-protein kinase/ABC transporter substrate-binding protein n=1 Tax=Streptomyces sp. NPDC127106 TaxID=3345360 RepID=UPI0036339551